MRPCTATLPDGRPCPNLSSGPRCAEHQRAHDTARNTARPWYQDPDYRRARSELVAWADANRAARCWLCRQGARPGDPWSADHDPPVSTAADWRACRLMLAHRSCNSARGNNRAPGGRGRDGETGPPTSTPA